MKTTLALGYVSESYVSFAESVGLKKETWEDWDYIIVPSKDIINVGNIILNFPRIYPIDKAKRIKRFPTMFIPTEGDVSSIILIDSLSEAEPSRVGSDVELHSVSNNGLRELCDITGLPYVEEKIWKKVSQE